MKDEEDRYGCGYRTIEQRKKESYSCSWGPVGFKKATHPLAIMVLYSLHINYDSFTIIGETVKERERADESEEDE